MGTHSSLLHQEQIPQEVIIANLDKNHVQIHVKLPPLPDKQVLKLKQCLTQIMTKIHFKKKALANIDMAFTLAPPPQEIDKREAVQLPFPNTEVRLVFFRLFVAAFTKYRSYMVKPASTSALLQDMGEFEKYFKRVQFLKEHSEQAKVMVIFCNLLFSHG